MENVLHDEGPVPNQSAMYARSLNPALHQDVLLVLILIIVSLL